MEPIRTAELLSIGTELTVGETRDTNAGDLARELTRRGVDVGRITALPDDLPAVTAAFRDALARFDRVVSTGGLGPTPDDLTREAIASLFGETPTARVWRSTPSSSLDCFWVSKSQMLGCFPSEHNNTDFPLGM